jgi:hypothetical protein
VQGCIVALVSTGFPTVEHLVEGARLYTLAVAVWAAGEDDPQVLEGWDGDTYLRNSGSGDSAAITFRGDLVVGGFFDHESPRSPYNPTSRPSYDWRLRFQGAPEAIVALAESDALQFLLQDMPPQGEVMPVITAAFWSVGERMTSCDSWALFERHGGKHLDVETITPARAIDDCIEFYELTAERAGLLRELHAQRCEGSFTLSPTQRKRLLGRKRRASEAAALLAAIGVAM